MAAAIRVSQVNLETPVTSEFGDILRIESESTQTIDEVIQSYSTVVVTCINLEIPVAQVAPTPPVVVTPGDAGLGAFVGGAAIHREKFLVEARSEQTLDETIGEVIVTSATSTQRIDTLIGTKVDPTVTRPVISRVPVSETIKFETVRSHEAVDIEQQEVSKEKLRQKEEDELILLGVLG